MIPYWAGGFMIKSMGVLRLMPALQFLKKFWRESLILLLITIMSIGYAYYTNKLSNSAIAIQNAELNYANAKANAGLLEEKLEELANDIIKLEDSNKDLNEKIAKAKVEIDRLNSIPPETIVRTIYETVLPEQCFGKFDWMLAEAIKMQDSQL